MRRMPLLSALLIVSACSADAGPAADDVAPWTLEPLARIGSVDDSATALVDAELVTIGPEGRLYVAEPRDGRIRVFGADGTPASDIGRAGEGPEEFGGITDLVFLGDTLYAMDVSMGRVALLSADGTWFGTRPWQAERMPGDGVSYAPGSPQRFVPLAGGAALVRPAMASRRLPPRAEPGVVRGDTRLPLLRVDPATGVQDTLLWEERRSASLVMMHEGAPFQILSPFESAPLSDLVIDGSGAVAVERDPPASGGATVFRVVRVGPTGDTLWVREMSYTPIPLDGERVRRAIEETSAVRRDPSRAPAVATIEDALRSEGLIPESVAPVSALATGQDGTIWLGREVVGETRGWDVLGADGGTLGRVVLPAGQTVVAALGDVLVAREIDALEVPYLMVYRTAR